MHAGGIIFMGLAWVVILGLNVLSGMKIYLSDKKKNGK
jgi:hypothetical protein